MKIIETKIKRVKPRAYREVALIKLESNDIILESKTNLPRRVEGLTRTVSAKRTIRKNGKPLSPWRFIIGSYGYTLEKQGESMSPRGGARPGAGRKPGKKDPVRRKPWTGRLPIYVIDWLVEHGENKKGKSQADLVANALIQTYEIKKPSEIEIAEKEAIHKYGKIKAK